MATTERAIIILSADGKRVLFTSPRCRVTASDEGSLTFRDLCTGPPAWVRAAESNVELMGNQ